MSDAYASMRQRVAAVLGEWRTGAVTLSRVSRAAPDPQAPWLPGTPVATVVYDLDAVVKGVTTEYVDGTTVLATDLVVIVSPKARLAGVTVDFTPLMTDTLTVDGSARAIKKIAAVPAAGPPARFNIFVAS